MKLMTATEAVTSDGIAVVSTSPRRVASSTHVDGGSGLPYLRGLDGVRGIAVAAVVLFHLGFGWAGGGFLGVSLFFTLSGYLITSLLLVEHERTGRVSLRGFWARRARRILPASLLTLVAVAVAARWLSAPASLPGDVRAALAQVANWRFVAAHRSYAELFALPSPLRHLWSLAIEEQCYLVLPLVAVAALRGGRRRLLMVLIALAAASVAASFALSGASFDRVYLGTDTRAIELLVGAVAACLITPARVASLRGRRSAALVGVSTAGLVALWSLTRLDQGWLRHGFGLFGLVNVAFVLGAITAPSASLLGRRPLVALGRISYGLYLFHWPVITWLTVARTHWHWAVVDLARVALSIGLATLSYRFVERPIRQRRLHLVGGLTMVSLTASGVLLTTFALTVAPMTGAAGLLARYRPAPVPTTGAPLVAAATDASAEASGGTAGATNASAEASGGTAAATNASAEAPGTTASDVVTTAPASPTTVWLSGDSVPYSLAPAMDALATAAGVRLVNLSVPGCDGARGWTTSRTGFGPDTEDRPDCLGWEQRWPSFASAAPPDAVMFVLGGNIVVDRLIDGAWRSPCEPEFRDWYQAEVLARVDWVVANTHGTPVLTVSPYADSKASGLLPDDHRDRVDCVNAVYRAVAVARPSIRLLDLQSVVCPAGHDRSCLPWRPTDGLHFEGQGAELAARWLLDNTLSAIAAKQTAG